MKWWIATIVAAASAVWIAVSTAKKWDEQSGDRRPVRIDVSSVFEPAVVRAVRKQPASAGELFDRFRSETDFRDAAWLNDLTESEQAAVFCCLLSYASAPYGNSLALTIDELLAEDVLDCDNYALLAKGYFDVLRNERGLADLEFEMVGWHGGPFGNHAILFVNGERSALLLDPTIAVVAECDFDRVASGRPVDASRIVDFSWRTRLDQFRGKLIAAVRDGECRPSHLLYYFNDLDRYAKQPGSSDLLDTPGGAQMRDEAGQTK